ncbi:MAG: hypothetical protein CL916_03140 [Deltaproteobacteria bacterium]|nr:hypothetical protein [Deltaproteobacteria bacterium]
MNTPHETILKNPQILEKISQIFLEVLPFNTLFHYRIGKITNNRAELIFDRRDEFIGNQMQNILHGGVISSALDTVGGLIAARSLFIDTQECTIAEFNERFSKLGTVNLHVDFLRPGKGTCFTASAQIERMGNKIGVFRVALHNEQNIQIASGVATYLVG